MTSQAQTSQPSTVYLPPARKPIEKPSVILYGNIPKKTDFDWHTSITSSLADLPIAIINPRRDDWGSDWKEDLEDPRFKEQVEWEMDHAWIADVIVFHFAPGALTPISLLELGMYAGTGKVVVCCPPGFYKRGNVQIVCKRYKIPLTETVDDLEKEVRQRLLQKLKKV
jgi:hypothetical protein